MPSKASRKITFPGAHGHDLAARLELPDGPPKGYALFAHCFTCSKDSLAASRIASALAARGIAVLRFDFTGLGGSEGEFANTDFTSNVDDLVAAARCLEAEHAAPRLLIGHSLGGAAVLVAAARIDSVGAVATINAPADPQHVAGHFADKREEIERNGAAEVSLGGRAFTIRKAFLEDIAAQPMNEAIRGLKRPLLICHAPRDNIVDTDNAARIFGAAMHPKSFLSLDDADHLLTRRADAAYAAEVIAAWAGRYIGEPPAEEAVADTETSEEGMVTVQENGAGRFRQDIVVGGKFVLQADEPEAMGGDDTGPSPYDFLLAGLGACTAMTIRMYADHKKLPLERVSVALSHAKVHAADCQSCKEKEKGGKIDRIERMVRLEGDLDKATRQRLLEIADKCPVHRTLHAKVDVLTREAED